MPNPELKTVTLTAHQWELICDAVSDYQDEGPVDEGWKSDKMREAWNALNDALNAQVNT